MRGQAQLGFPLPPRPCKVQAAWEPVHVLLSTHESALDPGFDQSLLSNNLKKESMSSVALKQSQRVRKRRPTRSLGFVPTRGCRPDPSGWRDGALPASHPQEWENVYRAQCVPRPRPLPLTTAWRSAGGWWWPYLGISSEPLCLRGSGDIHDPTQQAGG